MGKKCCCCSSVLSCFSCFSATNNPTSPSSAPQNISFDASSRHEEGSSSSGILAAVKPDEAPSGGGSSPSRVPSIPAGGRVVPTVVDHDSTHNVVPTVASSSGGDASANDKVGEGASSSSSASSRYGEGSSSSRIPAAVKPDEAPSGGGSSPSRVPSIPARGGVVPTVVDHDSTHNVVPIVASSSSRNDDATLTSQIIKDVDGENADLDGLMNHISQLMELIEAKHSPQIQRRSQEYLPTTSEIFPKLKKFLFDAKDVIPGEAIKTVISVTLKGMVAADLVTTAFVVVANILERFQDVGDNKDACITLLKEMFFLAKLVKQFRERPQLMETQEITDIIKEATVLIVEGSILCCTQMKASKFSKFWSTSVNKEDLSTCREKLNSMYTRMNAQMGIRLFDVSAPKKPRLSRGYPEHAVGMEKPVKRVLELLEWESNKKAVAVILHGFGGMGKTTLGDAVFSRADFEGCKYSQVRLFQNIGSIPDIMELQKCIFKDLTGPEETTPDIRTYEDGQRELGNTLKNVPAFIYIDNVLGEKELMQLLPKDFDTSKKVRLILTARDSIVGRACPRKTSIKTHSMESISKGDATRFLEREVLDDMEGKLNSSQIDNIIEVCGGVPLMLTLVAKVLRFEEDKQKAYNMVMQDKQNVEGLTYQGKEEYFFAYESLPEKCRDPFLDVCSFFKGWEWDRVADIVGEFEMDILQKRSLVNKDINGYAFVHDVILTIGHEKAKGTRLKFTSSIQFDEFLHHTQDKENQGMPGIKGIWLSENKDPLILSASTLDSMCKSLRVLVLGNLTKVEGQCNEVFENLLCFQGGITHLPFRHMSQLKELRCLDYEPEDLTLPKMPSSLRYMQFDGRLHSPAFQISSTCLQQLKNLRILRLINFIKLKKLPEGIGDQVKDLQELSLSYCKSIEELPRSVSRLQSLRLLRLDYCSSLTRLPEDFGSLKSLQELQLQGCSNLRQLAEDFGSLNSLQALNLHGCTGLKALPNNFEKLSSLRILVLSSCENLEDLPHGLGNLSSLVTLDGFPNCRKLRSIPDTIGQLKLTGSTMDMSHCSSLTELPDGFCNFSWITHLDLTECKSLERLPNQFGELASLRWMYLDGCSSLHRLPEGFGQLKYLEILSLEGCKSLEELCDDFHSLKSLYTLNLTRCESLKKLPEDFHRLTSLRILWLGSCAMLEGKSMDNVTKIRALKTVDIEGSGMLLDRWAEIQRESDQSLPFTVFTGQGISAEAKENNEKNMLSQLEFLLSEGREKPFHLSHSLLLVVYDAVSNHNFPWPLIEETIDDIQIDFEMVYIGSHFDKLPPKAKNIIVGHLDYTDEVVNLYVKMGVTVGECNEDQLEIIQMSLLEDGVGVQCSPSWKYLTFLEMEEFLLCRCRKYLQLKQLIETSQESSVNLLTELFATGEDQTCTFQKAPRGNSKPLTCTAEELKGKTILLEMRPLDVCYDVRLESLTQLYNTQKETFNLEIISIPLARRSSSRRLDVFEQFSRDIPWLVFPRPWAIPSAAKYFLLKMLKLSPDECESWSSSEIKIIEPDGRIFTGSQPVLRLLDRWGSKAYPFTVEKIKELKEEEWNQMETMPTLEFLFKHLESVSHQVKEMMLHSKVVCLYGGIRSENMMREYMCLIQKAFIGVRDNIHIIYFPFLSFKDAESIPVIDKSGLSYLPWEKFPLPHPEMEGMLLLNLSRYDTIRFWRRLKFLREEMPEMYKRDTDQLGEVKKLIQCFEIEDELIQCFEIEDKENPWMILMDEGGKIITTSGRKIVLSCTAGSMEDKAQRWTELLIKGSKEQRKQALLELEQLPHV